MTEVDVLIVGAGAAGLMCGLTAGQRGRRVRVLDAKRLHATASGCEADIARAAARPRRA